MDWPAIIDKYLFVKSKIPGQVQPTQAQQSKLFVKTGTSDPAKRSDAIFEFTNKFVMEASSYLPAYAIKQAINYLDKMGEDGKFCTTEAHRTTAINITMPILHPECILEWVHALDLRIS